ncbi:MAG: DUF2207 domain-containing protein [Clostridiales bacterium]|nr:DUF2207 domain-containing protein [Candidatus Crickella caballi]
MLKKRYDTVKVILFATAFFACAMFILWRVNAAVHLRTQTIVFTTLALGYLVVSRSISITIGRNAEVVEQPMDYPPDGIDPIQSGCVIDGIINNRDITAAFFYMAQKGYFTIREYERKQFVFEYIQSPKYEHKAMIALFNAIFGDGREKAVKLTECADRIKEALPKVKKNSIKSISSKKNKEIANITGKVQGFKNRLISNRGEHAEALIAADPEYVYKVFPYAYSFSVTAKLARNFDFDNIDPPTWYVPYGVDEDYKFDVVVYNSIVKNLLEQLNKEVF